MPATLALGLGLENDLLACYRAQGLGFRVCCGFPSNPSVINSRSPRKTDGKNLRKSRLSKHLLVLVLACNVGTACMECACVFFSSVCGSWSYGFVPFLSQCRRTGFRVRVPVSDSMSMPYTWGPSLEPITWIADEVPSSLCIRPSRTTILVMGRPQKGTP